MKIALCLDENDGMLFAHRRQSQDRALRADLLTLVGDAPLWMSEYSARQFTEPAGDLRVSEDCLTEAGEDWCFVEAPLPDSVWDTVTELVIYRWNRRYPSDVRFVFPADYVWEKTNTQDFPGYSHEVITREVYVK